MNKVSISVMASLAILLTSCGDDSKNGKNTNGHSEGDSRNHSTEQVEKTVEKIPVKDRNDKGELIDAAGHLITGCPGHKEMIGSPGDMCPKCDYMTMIPITWDIKGVDTVRVTTLANYNPPAEKLKK